jgi:hypothetical protein
MTLDDLLARESIRDLIARYNSYGDTGRFEPLFELFAEHAVMEIGPAGGGERTVYDGRENIKKIFTGAMERNAGQSGEPGPSFLRHMTATHQIDLIDTDHATGRCYFAVLMDQGLDHWGRYVDKYVRIDGEWKFEDRRVTIDATNPDSWFTHRTD